MSNSFFSAPIDFEFYNDDQEPILFLTDDVTGHSMTLALSNTSSEEVSYGSTTDYHYELVFRPQTLANTAAIQVQTTGYSMVGTATKNQDGTVSIFIKSNQERQWSVNEKVVLSGFKAEAGIGTRNTRVMLRYKDINHQAGDFSGNGEQQLSIVNSVGRINIPLQVGFVGDNHVLNDGVTQNTLTLRISNPERLQTTLSGSDNSKLVLVFQGGVLDEEWALGTGSQLDGIAIRAVYPGGVVVLPLIDASLYYNPEVGNSEVGTTEQTVDFRGLNPGEFLDIEMSNIITGHSVGHTNLVVHYENISGYRDGQFVLPIEKSPIIIKDKKVAIGKASLRANLNIRADENIGGLYVESASAGQTWLPYTNNWNYISGSGLRLRDQDHLEKMRFDFTSGRVGIGTTSPKVALDVVGTIQAKEGIRTNSITSLDGRNWEIASNGEHLEIREPEESNRVWLRITDDKALHLIGTPNLHVDGKVGIGTVSPDSSLHVIPNAEGAGIITGDGRSGITRLPATDGNNYISGISTFFLSQELSRVAVIDGARRSMGIGTDSPQGNLHISSGDSGLCKLILEADTDNRGEADNPHLIFRQDGGQDQSALYMDSNRLILANSVSSGGITFRTGTTYPYTRATEKMRIASNGKVGIGTTNPQKPLHVKDLSNDPWPGIRIDGRKHNNVTHYWDIVMEGTDTPDQDLHFFYNKNLRGWLDSTSGGFKSNSDQTLKDNIKPLGSVLKKVCQLAPKTYTWKEGGEKEGKEEMMGFIAQEVEAVFPKMVKEKLGKKSLGYSDFGILAVAAIKEQQEEIKSLETQMEAQKKEQKSQQSLIELLVKRLDVLETKHH